MLKLKSTLFLNGISSGITGAILIIYSKKIAEVFGATARTLFIEIGLFLLLFSLLVLNTALRSRVNNNLVKLITALDVLWVVTSAISVVLLAKEISLVGLLLIIVIALWVAAMAFLQTKGLKQN